jgi:methyltransferase
MTAALVVFVAAFVPMIVEARLSKRHERALRLRGALEPQGDVYAIMQAAYPACFLGIVAEGWLRSAPFGAAFGAGALLFTLAKILKYWAIRSLGGRWTFRVLVPPDERRVRSGPYRYLDHPNYLGVAGEIAGAALMARAPVAGVLSFLLFGGLMLARIRIEERALDAGVR